MESVVVEMELVVVEMELVVVEVELAVVEMEFPATTIVGGYGRLNEVRARLEDSDSEEDA